MILDEPTAHLDLINRMEIMLLLRQIAHTRNKAILVVTHDLALAAQIAQLVCECLELRDLLLYPRDMAFQQRVHARHPAAEGGVGVLGPLAPAPDHPGRLAPRLDP